MSKDYYQTLGVPRTANQDEIKQAFRRLAAQHHPDRGGDTAKFQEIQAAYAVLSDPEQRAQHDNPSPFGGHSGGGFHFGGGVPPGFEDIFSAFSGMGGNPFFGQGFRQQQRNRNLNLQTTITLEEAFLGKNLMANIGLPSGLEQVLEVKIPPGVRDGTVLRLAGMGDDTVSGVPRGDIHLTINIQPHHIYQRQGDDLLRTLTVSCFDAILGKTVKFDTIDGKTLEVNIAPGTQPGQTLAVQGYGMPHMSDQRMKGRLLLEINVTIPPNLTEKQKDLVRQIIS
jgi:DnaJ-class molecular chaperone